MRAAAAALIAALAVSGCDEPAPSGPLALAVSAVATPAVPCAPLQPAGALALQSDLQAFGGLSGVEISADGARMVAVTDRGFLVEARLERGPDQRLAGVSEASIRPLRGPAGEVPRRVRRDAEGLALLGEDVSGPAAVSFERLHRIGRFETLASAEAEGPALPREVRGRSANSGLEALALAPDGRLLALVEHPAPGRGGSPALWLHPDGAVTLTEIEAWGEDLRPVGADFGPDGRLYVVGRSYSPLGGFRYAIWRHAPRGHVLGPPELLLEAPGGDASDNAEGLAAWRDAAGRLRLTLVTDDNLNVMQRTLVIEYVLEEVSG